MSLPEVSSGGADAGLASAIDAGPPQPADLPLVVTAPLADGGFEPIDGQVCDLVLRLTNGQAGPDDQQAIDRIKSEVGALAESIDSTG